MPDSPQFRSYVALGDSFTEGMEDDVGPQGRHLGWADRVATALASASGGMTYANLAVRGRILDPVVAEQVPAALALHPDLVSFCAGGNDVLRPGTDIAGVLRRYDAAVERLVAGGSQVLLLTVIEGAGGTSRTAQRLSRRFAAYNAGVRASAARHGCILADLGAVPAFREPRLYAEDRLHLGAEGHRRVAGAVLEALGVRDPDLLGGEPGWWRAPLPPPGPVSRLATWAGDVRWLRRHLLPWVGRRLRRRSTGDLVGPKHTELVDVLPR